MEDITQHKTLAQRILFLMTFKETKTQNLRFIMKVLGVETCDEKKECVGEVFRLVRESVLYISKGISDLISNPCFDDETLGNVELCLLPPLEGLVSQLQVEANTYK